MTAIKLLLVEDEVLIVMDLQALVERLGHHVVGVSADGSTALDLARLVRPDLALVDLTLRDGFTGPTAGLELAAHGIFVLFVTAIPAEAPLADPRILGVISKPYDSTELVAALTLLSTHPREDWGSAAQLLSSLWRRSCVALAKPHPRVNSVVP